MMDHNAPPNGEEPRGRGQVAPLSSVQENKIVAMMLNPRRRWRLSKAAKSEAVAVTLNNMADEDGRVRNQAVANLIRMEAQNLADQHKFIDKHTPDLHQTIGSIEHRITVAELLESPDYVEWCRERERDSQPGSICPNGHQGDGGPLANGESRNGH